MKLLRKNKTVNPDNHDWQDKAALMLFDSIHRSQVRFAAVMHRNLNHLPVRKKKVLFIIFFMLTGGLSGYYIFKGFLKSEGITYRTDKIRFPINPDSYGDHPATMTEDDYESILSFKRYMDSLQRLDKGKYQYDSILQARPGLMDSVQVLEQKYLSQQKH
ncbi:MAG: hypothetical protein ABI861_12070 [Panacibacter sp.]